MSFFHDTLRTPVRFFMQEACKFSAETHCHLFKLFTFVEIWSCLGLGWLTFPTNISDWYGLSLSWFNRLKSSKKEFEFCTSGFTQYTKGFSWFAKAFFCVICQSKLHNKANLIVLSNNHKQPIILSHLGMFGFQHSLFQPHQLFWIRAPKIISLAIVLVDK